MVKSRIVYLDAAKAIAIFLVVLGHVVVVHNSGGYYNLLAQVIYSFHTALFMFLSGYFFESCLKRDIVTLLREKCRQLLLPYLSWSAVSLFLISVPEAGFENIIMPLKDYILGGVFRYYWYFKALFFYIIVTYSIIKVIQNKWVGSLLALVLFTLLPNFAFSKIFIPFFLAGYLSRPLLEKDVKWKGLSIVLFVNVVLFILWKPEYNYTRLDMHVIPYLVRTGLGIVTSVSIVLFLKKICSYGYINYKMSRIAFIGTLTLGIYACHELLYTRVLWGWLLNMLPKDSYVVHIIWAVCALVMSCVIVVLFEKNRWLSFLFLGKRLAK